MKSRLLLPHNYPELSRRRFVTGLAAGSALLATGISTRAGAADTPRNTTTLRGNRFDLSLGSRRVNFTGRERLATVVNESIPGPVLRWQQGDTVQLNVSNKLATDSSIHWHGIILPPEMDGVPGISFAGIQPGTTFKYQFPVIQSGTYWYHSHSGFQEQTGLYGALIIDPIAPEPFRYDRDYVVVLSDWSDSSPENIFRTLKKSSEHYNRRPRTVQDTWQDLRSGGFGQTASDRHMWNRMRMSDRDISDVTGITYTYLMNGRPPAEGWFGEARPGETVRLRFVNAGAMTFFDVRIPGLKMTVVAADGQYIEPVTVDEFRLGAAETYDVLVTADDAPHAIFAQAIDRSGYALGTMGPNPSEPVAAPDMDPAPLLTHGDMGMAHGVDGAHDMHDHQQHAGNANAGKAGYGSNAAVVHAASEYGPGVDMRAENPRFKLDDPGIGLRNNGRRVLCYADLRSLAPTADPREPGREIQLHLTGNMSRYMWSFDGLSYKDAEPLLMTTGERLRVTLVNDTMMNHPIHLHGMWSDLETGDGKHIPRKHTVIVQPGSKISYLVTPELSGDWAYHCHLLYHMMGMFRRVQVS
ncbi:MAG: copper resistance system multicopper oxidase [Gammaproteobacteria bacterium]